MVRSDVKIEQADSKRLGWTGEVFKEPHLVRVKCSPNPSNGRLNVLISDMPDKPAKLTVYYRYGGVLHTSYITGTVTSLSMVKQPKGLYYVEVNINNKKYIVPLVIQ